MSYVTSGIRNVALAGPAASGKTTLFEALMVAGGSLQVAGTLERGSTLSDFDPMEKQRLHSIQSAIASIDRGDIHINLIDTPGHAEFLGPALAALDAVETVAIIVDASQGVDHAIRRLMSHARSRGDCRMLVINKIDADGVDLPRLVDQLRDEFGSECLPINLPAAGASKVVDCFAKSDGVSDFSSVAEAHERIVDQVVEINDAVMNRFLDKGEKGISGSDLHDAFEQCLREGHLVPICFVSARSGAGVDALLSLIERLLPHPGEGNPPPFVKGHGKSATAVVAKPDPDLHVLADVFKIVNDPFVGKLCIFRVFQGTLRRDSQLYVDDGRRSFKVNHLFRIHGKDHVEIEQAIPGDIAAVAKIDDIHFDAVLHDSHDEDAIHLKPQDFPQPMFGLAIEPAHKGQEQKLASALAKLSEEDPCFRVEHNIELNETVIRGLSDLHLKLVLEQMKDRYGVEVESRPPRIAYRETVAGKAEGHHRHKKQTGGAGQFGEVQLRVEPLPRGHGFEFIDEVKGGAIPHNLIPAVEKGVRQVLESGAVAGYAMQDLKVTLLDGKHHPVDSKEIAFVTAGRKAFLDAIQHAGPVLLEPVVHIDIHVPDRHVGDITGSLSSKRARIHGTDAQDSGELLIKGQVPLAEIADFQTELRSLTGGKGRYMIEFSHYDPVPPTVQRKLIDEYRPRAEED